MRVMLRNPMDRPEILVVDNVAICINKTCLRLGWNDSDDVINVITPSAEHARDSLNDLLINGYVDLTKYAADYKKRM